MDAGGGPTARDGPPTAQGMTPHFEVEKFRPTRLRTRLLIVLAAVAMAAVVMGAVFDPQARLARLVRLQPDRPLCEAGQSQNCVGGKVDFIAVPPARPASRPRRVRRGRREHATAFDTRSAPRPRR